MPLCSINVLQRELVSTHVQRGRGAHVSQHRSVVGAGRLQLGLVPGESRSGNREHEGTAKRDRRLPRWSRPRWPRSSDKSADHGIVRLRQVKSQPARMEESTY